MSKATLTVEGMSCKNCAKHVTDALKALPFVKRASADPKKGRAEIVCEGIPDESKLKDAVDQAGYTLTGVTVSSK